MKRLPRAFALIGLCCLLSQSAAADEIADRIRSTEFQPIREAQLQQRRDAARTALHGAQAMLQYAGSGPAWRDYLLWDSLEDAISETAVDESTIEAVTASMYRLAGLHDGIERSELIRLRDRLVDLRRGLVLALRQQRSAERMAQYEMDLQQFPDDPILQAERPETLEQQYQQRRDALAEMASRLASAPATVDMRQLAAEVDWFRTHEQLTDLLATLSMRHGRSNVHVDVSATALATLTARQVYEVEPIRETQDKAVITGQAVITGVATMRPVSGQAAGQCEVRFEGTVESTMNGRQGPVSFVLRGDTALTAQKTVIFADDRFSVLQGSAQAHSNLRTEQVCSKFRGGIGKLVRRIAGNEIAKEQPQARHDLSQRSRDSFLKRFDEDIAEEIAEARGDFEIEVKRSLLRLNLQPKTLDFLTDPTKLTVALRFDNGLSQPAHTVLPVKSQADIDVTVHESTVASICQRIYAGRKIDDIRREFQVLGIELSDKDKEQIPDGIGIHFADDRPVEVEFEDDQISIILRGQTWFLDNSPLVAMNVRFGYAVQQREGMYVAVRRDDVQVTAPEGMRGGRFIQQMNVLKRRLVTELPKEFVFENIPVEKLPKPADRLGTLRVASMKTAGGWLAAGLLGDRWQP